jgi:hypothetical protein
LFFHVHHDNPVEIIIVHRAASKSLESRSPENRLRSDVGMA